MHSSLIISTTLLLLTLRVSAQTTDAVNSFLSEAFSVYTEVTSILASDASNAASATSSSTTSSSTSTTTTSSSSSTLSTSSTTASPSSTRASSTTATAAAATTSAAAHHGGGLSSTNLAIILGCVLGALALGLLVLVLLLCCRRRRRSRAGSPRLLSPDGREIESWRGHKNRPHSRDGLIGAHDGHNYRNENAGEPSMSEHPAFANDHNHQNPFVPVPPAPRRSAPNSRAGLTDGTVPGQEPFVSNSNDVRKDHHHGRELAAGAGGAALGAAALHHHDKNRYNDEYKGPYDQKPGFMRRSVPENAYPTTTTNDDAYALNKVPSRKSGEATRPYDGDDYGYGTGPYEAGQRGLRQPNTSAPLSPFNAAGHHRGPSNDNGHLLMAAGAGALGGAALATHHNRDRSNSAPRRSYDSAKTRGPNALLDHTRHPMPVPVQDTHPAHDLVSPISSDSYSSAQGIPGIGNNHHNNNTLSGSTATNNSHHIPCEMPGDVPTPPASASPRHSFGANAERPRSYSGGAPAAAALAYPNHRRNGTPPNLPGRSPRRTRFSDLPDTTAAQQQQRDSDPSTHTSDDSTWRLSSGMPGGWGRNNAAASSRRDSSPAANSEHLRNAGINLMGRRESPVRHSMPGATAAATAAAGRSGRRLRLADLKREEEEKMEMERRGRMGSEWGGSGSYDGYHGVGQAM